MQNKINNIQPKPQINHSISLENQSKALITGVLEVITATNTGVLCRLSANHLQIAGNNLRVEKLSPEEKMLVITGTVNEIKYISSTTKTGFFKKLFR